MEIIEIPNMLSAENPEQAIREIQRYLFRMAEQLNQALETTNHAVGLVRQEAASQKPGSGTGQSPAATFAKIKSLIIKSADIINAYSEAIDKTLEGKYVAESTFGTYREETTAHLSATDKRLEQSYTLLEEIQSSVEELAGGIRQVNAYIRTGLLYEDENGIGWYGVEIGQQSKVDGVEVFRKFARLISDRLSFYDQNDVEVAYVSDRKLYITSAQVQEINAKRASVQSLEIGGYVLMAGNDGHLTLS